LSTIIASKRKKSTIRCRYAFVLTDNGYYCFGSNVTGQLGLSDTNYRKIPAKFEFDSKIPIKELSVGYFHAFITTTDGRFFSFGRNDCGQLGTGDNIYLLNPVEWKNNIKETIKTVICCQSTYFLTSNGLCYYFGRRVKREAPKTHYGLERLAMPNGISISYFATERFRNNWEIIKIILLGKKKENCIFSKLPNEIIKEISERI